MYLILSILLSMILGYLLFVMGPIVGGIAAFGIIAGSLFRVIYLLNAIRKRLAFHSPESKEVQAQVIKTVPEHLKNPNAYKKYLEGKERGF
ncbi:hypothetical protein [Mesobacillus thioparans]|uniref:hypothetical protein n=1 Tax=Mesobacillus thioparans TaxID=370439 RepID=UPI0039F11C54